MKSLRELSLKDKRILMRVDFNVPMKEGEIADDSRIRASLPSIQYVLDQGGRLILMSHLGRPKKSDPSLSLRPCAKRLSELLQKPVLMAPDCVGAEVEKMAMELKDGEVMLLENLRFHPGEEDPNPTFVSNLAKLGQVYVNDAFGTAHRAHASTALIANYFPETKAAGFLMEKEVAVLRSLIDDPKRPFFTLIGGAKISTKIGLIKNLLKSVDALFVGGAMAFTFLKAQGIEIGDSLVELDSVPLAKEILGNKNKIFLPIDLVIADKFSNDAAVKIISIREGIPKGWQGLDIGPATVKQWSKQLAEAATIFWNGPLGAFEMANFAKGTEGVALALSQLSAKVVVGGGDSVAAVEQMGFGEKFYHLSTGGGASLEFLEYGHLPGIDALSIDL